MTVKEFMFEKSGCSLGDSGYEFLELAIELKMDDPNLKMGNIYYDISKRTGLSSYCIERRISRAIKRSFLRMDESIKKKIFRNSVDDSVCSKTYINTIIYAIKNNLI